MNTRPVTHEHLIEVVRELLSKLAHIEQMRYGPDYMASFGGEFQRLLNQLEDIEVPRPTTKEARYNGLTVKDVVRLTNAGIYTRAQARTMFPLERNER